MSARNAAALASLAILFVLTACTGFYEIPIETPIQPKMDVSGFQRVLVAGFLSGGTEDATSLRMWARPVLGSGGSRLELPAIAPRRLTIAGSPRRVRRRGLLVSIDCRSGGLGRPASQRHARHP